MKKKPTTDKIAELRTNIETRINNLVKKSKTETIPVIGVYECFLEDNFLRISSVGNGFVKTSNGKIYKFSRLSLEELGEIDDMVNPPKL